MNANRVHERRITYHLNGRKYLFTYIPGKEDELLEDLKREVARGFDFDENRARDLLKILELKDELFAREEV